MRAEMIARLLMVLVGFILAMLGVITFIHGGEHHMLGILITFGGVVLNETMMNESSSLALSIYSPTNLADLLTDEVEQTRDEKIAIAKQLLQAQQNSLN